jgi:hypothetical protein
LVPKADLKVDGFVGAEAPNAETKAFDGAAAKPPKPNLLCPVSELVVFCADIMIAQL